MDKIILKNGLEVKRHFYHGKDYKIDEENKVVELNSELKVRLLNKNLWGMLGYKKVGGSSLGGVLGSNSFETPFLASTKLMWLGEPMYDPKYVDAGIAIEPKIIQAMEKMSGKTFKTFPAVENNYDYFKELEHLGGLPDAAILEEEKVYELKTTGEKNMDKWDQYGVPEYYRQQVCVYDFLMFGRKAKFQERQTTLVACFLKPEDYVNPKNVDVSQRVIKTYKLTYTADEVTTWIKQAVDFRKNIMREGKSLQYDENNPKDVEALEYLRCKDVNEWRELLVKRGLL